MRNKKNTRLKRAAHLLVVISFCVMVTAPMPSYAQMPGLPVPGTMVGPSPAFMPVMLKGLKIDARNPLRFDFIIGHGDTGFNKQELKDESLRLVKYFLAALTVPEKDLWVNLSPYEENRIIPGEFGVTEMGVDLLAQDYILKQLTASLIYPEDDLGKKFWDRVHAKAQRLYGTRDIPMDTFNKIWIVPEKASVYEHGDSVFVVDSHMKVMLEEDYLALEKSSVERIPYTVDGIRNTEYGIRDTKVTNDIIRSLILPEIEREVNEGQNFTNLRQIYHALILATWFKKRLKESVLGHLYVDQNKINGVDVRDRESKEKIYDQYVAAYKKGVYNYIKEEYDPVRRQMIPKKYFSGGALFTGLGAVLTSVDEAMIGEDYFDEQFSNAKVDLTRAPRTTSDQAMLDTPLIRLSRSSTHTNRNAEIIGVLESPLFPAATGINLREGAHTVVNIGVGAKPYDTILLAETLRKMNPRINVYGTELPLVSPKAYITSAALIEEFRGEIANVMEISPRSIIDLKLVVAENDHVIAALIGFKRPQYGKTFYSILTVAAEVEYIGFGGREDARYRHEELFKKLIDFLGKDNLDDLIKQEITQSKGGVSIEFNPMQEELKKSGATFVPTDNLTKAGLTGLSVVLANYVVMYMTPEEKEDFKKMIKEALQEGGVLILTDAGYRGDNPISFYRRRGGELVELGKLLSVHIDGQEEHRFDRKINPAVSKSLFRDSRILRQRIINNFDEDVILSGKLELQNSSAFRDALRRLKALGEDIHITDEEFMVEAEAIIQSFSAEHGLSISIDHVISDFASDRDLAMTGDEGDGGTFRLGPDSPPNVMATVFTGDAQVVWGEAPFFSYKIWVEEANVKFQKFLPSRRLPMGRILPGDMGEKIFISKSGLRMDSDKKTRGEDPHFSFSVREAEQEGEYQISLTNWDSFRGTRVRLEPKAAQSLSPEATVRIERNGNPSEFDRLFNNFLSDVGMPDDGNLVPRDISLGGEHKKVKGVSTTITEDFVGPVWIRAGSYRYKIWVEDARSWEVNFQRFHMHLNTASGIINKVSIGEDVSVGTSMQYSSLDPLLESRHFSFRVLETEEDGQYTLKLTDWGTLNGTTVTLRQKGPGSSRPGIPAEISATEKNEDLTGIDRAFNDFIDPENFPGKDQAMVGKSKDVGGIDFDPSRMDLNVEGSGISGPLRFDLKNIDQIKIDGLVPVIINLTPIHNLHLLMGIADSKEQPRRG